MSTTCTHVAVDEDAELPSVIAAAYTCTVLSIYQWVHHRLRQAAVLTDPGSGRSVEVATSAPGLQFYSGNFLDGTTVGKGGVAYPKYGGVALESQVHHDNVAVTN
jgi:galactose mutarotase-like enzyme